jgi:hypothetical protein
MKINKLEYAKCPYCNTLLNDFKCYPLSILMHGGSDMWEPYNCTVCGKLILLNASVTVTLKADRGEPDE